MTTTYPKDFAPLAEARDEPERQPAMARLRERMVRELELFLSYALASDTQQRWIGMISRPCGYAGR